MSLSVTATQSWVLAIETRATRKSQRAQWSRQNGRGFSNIAQAGSIFAQGKLAAAPVAADLFVRNAPSDAADAILLTVTTP
jgi:hypothetical protein